MRLHCTGEMLIDDEPKIVLCWQYGHGKTESHKCVALFVFQLAGAKLPAFTNVLPSGPLFIGLPISGSTPIISH